MPTSRSDFVTRRATVLPGLLALALTLSGCGGGDPQQGVASPGPVVVTTAPPTSTGPTVGEVAQAPDVVAALQRVLGHRTEAILAGDRGRFDEGVATRDATFVAQQHQYFANLRQLPLQTLSVAPDPATLVRDGTAYDVNVKVTLQLAGYDAVPVTTLDRYRFAPTPGGRHFRLVSVTDAAWEARNAVQSQPWDTGVIAVRTGAGVLGIFDEGSVDQAGPLIRSVETGIAAVSALVPYEWARTVVVYALSDDTFLASVPDLPGGNPEELDAVAFPVLADATSPGAIPADVASAPVAGIRLVLQSRMLERTGPSRDRLVRHELTHAALGSHDDHAPLWLSEGLAEYVSVQPEAPQDRSIAKPALAAARVGTLDLPADDTFNDADSAAHYGLAWWSCEYVALTAGPPALWTLLDQLEALGGQGTLDRATEDATLLAVVGVNTRTLARKAGKLLLTTFEPPPPPAPPAVATDPAYPFPSPAPTTPTTPTPG